MRYLNDAHAWPAIVALCHSHPDAPRINRGTITVGHFGCGICHVVPYSPTNGHRNTDDDPDTGEANSYSHATRRNQ
jgi:hypothetical protein